MAGVPVEIKTSIRMVKITLCIKKNKQIECFIKKMITWKDNHEFLWFTIEDLCLRHDSNTAKTRCRMQGSTNGPIRRQNYLHRFNAEESKMTMNIKLARNKILSEIIIKKNNKSIKMDKWKEHQLVRSWIY